MARGLGLLCICHSALGLGHRDDLPELAPDARGVARGRCFDQLVIGIVKRRGWGELVEAKPQRLDDLGCQNGRKEHLWMEGTERLLQHQMSYGLTILKAYQHQMSPVLSDGKARPSPQMRRTAPGAPWPPR